MTRAERVLHRVRGAALEVVRRRRVTAGNTSFDGAMSGPATHPWDWAGIIGTGQSLSVGAEAYNIVLVRSRSKT